MEKLNGADKEVDQNYLKILNVGINPFRAKVHVRYKVPEKCYESKNSNVTEKSLKIYLVRPKTKFLLTFDNLRD